MSKAPSLFQRLILPGFAFKAVIIGGGYATGRELVQFFFPSGPLGGVMGLLFAAAIWSVVATLTFLFALATDSYDYRTFFKRLLGPAWPAFEIIYILLILLVLSVFGAAAGEIFRLAFGLPPLVGTLALMSAIIVVVMAGQHAVESVFKYVSIFLYLVYMLVVALSFYKLGDRISAAFAMDVPTSGWAMGGLTYAGYNLIGAVVILPVARHLTSRRDAVIAGLLSGPLAALPGLLFFLCMTALYPGIGDAVIPSDSLLAALGMPILHVVFQLMILSALLESGVGFVHAVNERVASVYRLRGRTMSHWARFGVATTVLVGAVFVAARFGLVELVARGYGAFAWLVLAVYVVPLLTIGTWRLLAARRPGAAATDEAPASIG
ncbi:hypothetical protein GCM10023232_14720 [Sphingosinicella ginsenosidimutans]|jgi:uncharacterized membrane protein YkvI|uniref:Membrane protein YkvI n=1 Tax=Allosphingosinicella ginsenosidimutans TaxID=1176539 RepID=A0A5C6TQD3_9SPHN|nr:hypothetical protein [Sphingosinicella ginsenosidimutans]TXC62553.1 hypothetical protein FRZ32_02095 [Sphingosinicella ginsenosidimutans]